MFRRFRKSHDQDEPIQRIGLRKSLVRGFVFGMISWSMGRIGEPKEGEHPGKTYARAHIHSLYESLVNQKGSQAASASWMNPEEYEGPTEPYMVIQDLMFFEPPTDQQWKEFWIAMHTAPNAGHHFQEDIETAIFHTPWGWMIVRPDVANVCMPFGDDPEKSLQKVLHVIAQCAVNADSPLKDAEA